ncbi:MAG: hypothetical protein AAGG75_05760 [Bacteroidota bacterium]
MKDLRTSDLRLLCSIFGEAGSTICIFDPNNYIPAHETGEMLYFDRLEEMRKDLLKRMEEKLVLFNLSNNELLDIYCKENVLSILKFHERSSAVFNPFATYYYLTDEEGRINCIQSPGASKISLSLKKEAGLSARIQRSVAQQGFRMGLQRFLANGSFTFYHKGQNPVERTIKQEYDGFTININWQDGRTNVCLKAYHNGNICQTVEGQLKEFVGRLLTQ